MIRKPQEASITSNQSIIPNRKIGHILFDSAINSIIQPLTGTEYINKENSIAFNNLSKDASLADIRGISNPSLLARIAREVVHNENFDPELVIEQFKEIDPRVLELARRILAAHERQRRESMSPEQIQNERDANRERVRKHRAQMSPEAKAAQRKKDAERMRKRRAQKRQPS